MRCSRGYHIRIVVQRKPELSQSQPQADDAFIPSRLFQHLPAHRIRKRPPVDQNNLKPSNKDYRFGPIHINWVDFEDMNKAPYAVGKGRETNRVQEPYARAGTLQATFIPHTRSKSGTTNLPEGIVHVFREAATTDAPQEPVPPPPSPATEDSDGVILGVLAVPAYMTPSDFLTFVAPAVEGMAHLRLIRDSVPNRSIAVIKFFNPADAAEFVEAYNGKPFNSMDCLSKWGDSRCPVCRYSQILQSSHPTSSSTRSTLPIPFANPSTPTLSSCSSCSSTTNLWICLICGNIGCGRYGRAHAHAHYQSTTHLYALELETQRVWDYAGDGYVHRLIQNKADGKLVELPSAASSTGVPPRDGSLGPTQADALSAEKIEAIGIEYSYLLTSQLESQRSYYEDEEKRLKNQLAELKGQVDRLGQQLKEDAKKREDQEQARLAHVMKEKSRAEARAEKATELARRLDKELKEERAVSEGLMKNMNSMKERVERADKDKGQSLAKIHELEDQLRDVMFFLETRMKIESGEGPEAELAGGTLEVSSSADVSSETKKKKSRKR
ncbi:hypothetical protein C0989_001516 [Termitomyces sp. Mn162]|nr:hypothetical protein C0989_001516 [Termitomyces sp. Mn162]